MLIFLILGSDSRFRAVDEVLYINDIDYKDRQGYKCLGIGGNETITQTIILRVKGKHHGYFFLKICSVHEDYLEFS